VQLLSTQERLEQCDVLGMQVRGGGVLHVYMFAHNKSAYRDRNCRSETIVSHKREPQQQPRLLPSCTI
jgi:hypothetical protein